MEETKSEFPLKCIIAFDILPMSSTSRQGGVRLAASARLADGSVREWSNISRSKLLKITHTINADYLGTDNPTEILNDGEYLPSFCRLLPPKCSFIHANLTETGITLPISKLVKEYKVFTHKRKMSPIITSRAINKLIQKNVGMILEPFENETIIEVGRPRSRGKGGWSQARYERQGEEVVARAGNEIKRNLELSKFQFDYVMRKTKYGAKFARFHIFSPISDVSSYIRKLSLYPAKVKIWSPKKKVVTHRPIQVTSPIHHESLNRHLRRIIVGVDPGMTTGVAIADLQGKFLHVFSKKNLSKGELVSRLTNYGIPIIICSDVYPVPNFVSKLAATYNAEVIYPQNLLAQDDKRELAKKSLLKERMDSHERDATAAVVYAFRKYETSFEKLDKHDLTNKETDMAKGLLIRGLSVADCITSVKLLRKTEKPEKIEVMHQSEANTELIGRLHNLLEEMAQSEETINNLRAHTGRLETQLRFHEIRISKLIKKLKSITDKTTLDLLQSELLEAKDLQLKFVQNSLEDQIKIKNSYADKTDSLEQILWMSMKEDSLPIKVLPVFSKDSIYKLRNEKSLNDEDILLIVDPSGGGPQTSENLTQTKFKMIFVSNSGLSPDALSIFHEKKIPVMAMKNYNIQRINEFAIMSKPDFMRAMSDYQEWLHKDLAENRTNKINLEIDNYQYQRSKDLDSEQSNYDDFEPEEEEFNLETD